MPDAKDNAKLTGDTHPPEVEDMTRQSPQGRPKALGADGTPADQDRSREVDDEGGAGKGVRQAGDLKDKDASDAGGGRQR